MRPEREELIDFLLGELPAERHHAVADRVAGDPEAAAERDRLAEALAVLRVAAAEGWEAPPARARRLRLLRPALAAAALLLVALGFLLLRGTADRVYEPDGAYGYLLPEETDARGRVPEPSTAPEYLLRAGAATVSALGSERDFPLQPGESFPADSDLKTPADSAARVDLPGGGILFLAPLTTVRLRLHQDGGAALRLMDGVACTVAGGTPLHLAVHETDLLLRQTSGAALLRETPAEVITLRGDLELLLAGNTTFRVPPGERLPAACAAAPRTVPATGDELELQWYRDLVYRTSRSEDVAWERPGLSRPLAYGPDTLVYLRFAPTARGTLRLSFGGEPRTFDLRAGAPLELRLRLKDLGPGPQLELAPADALKAARLFEAVPR